MNTPASLSTTIIEGYFRLIANLTPDNKRELISKLTSSLQANPGSEKTAFKKAFGAWKSTDTAEQMIESLRADRSFTREIEPF